MSTLWDRASVEIFEFVVQSFAQQNQEIPGSAWECLALNKSAFLPFSFLQRRQKYGLVGTTGRALRHVHDNARLSA